MLTLLFALLLGAPPPSPPAQDLPRPEHPDPQAFRAAWLTLNGPWEYLETDDPEEASFLAMERFPETILVPFCRESTLSGIGRRGFIDYVWYRRSFEVPPAWLGRRVLLHFGASDWRTTAWLNDQRLGEHTGGNGPFQFELTGLLREGANTLVVRAFDDARSGLQQLGKQSRRPESHGIFYTRTTGIWQTVWLEAVGDTYIRSHRTRTLPARDGVLIEAELDGDWLGLELAAVVTPPHTGVAQHLPAQPVTGNSVTWLLSIDEPALWTPDEPNLYGLDLEVRRQGALVDRLQSYFGLRTVEIRGAQVLLNGRPVFQRLVLDQGFYPDGIWTAPSDEALRRDIELSKAAGFNGARLHQKVFEPRFHYWADRLGYLTWGEGPSFGADYERAEVALPVLAEWAELVRRDINHPSIVGWCPFNESPPAAAALQNAVYELTQALDGTRPVIETSGWVKSHPDPDVEDRHDYDQDPSSLARRYAGLLPGWRLPQRYGAPRLDRPFFVSEFGGIGWIPEGEGGWGYGNNPRTLDEFYRRYEGLTGALLGNPAMFAFCYTQLTDVEQERNGIYYYDRRPKFDLARIRAATGAPAAYEAAPPELAQGAARSWLVLSPAAVDPGGPAPWRYTLSDPGARDWHSADFDDRGWAEGRAGFGQKGGWEARIGTAWSSSDIWLRRRFEHDGAPFDAALLVLHYDNATSIWLNGQPLLDLQGWNDAYAPVDVTQKARALLRTGTNLLAVHVHQDTGGQFFDAALLLAPRQP